MKCKEMPRSSAMSKLHLAFLLLHVLLLLQARNLLAYSHSVVKSLPGFQGRLPFYLETGYVGVGEAEEVQLFYYFVKSDRNPKEDPLLLWFSGGPGCSALNGLVYEIGPIGFEIVEYNGSLPSLVLNPDSWTKVSNIIFLDSPVGAGFSYATSLAADQSSDSRQVHHSYQFLIKWLMNHPDFLSNPVYIGGDSYSGLMVPPLVQQIINGNEESPYPLVNLQGYITGNGITDPSIDFNYRIPFAHGMGLISDELYESLKKNCRGEYINIDPSNAGCLENIRAYEECTSRIEYYQILDPKCPDTSTPKPGLMFGRRRSLSKSSQDSLKYQPSLPDIGCHTYRYFLSPYWVNDYRVRKALHIREGTVETWMRCNFGMPYTKDIPSSFQFHVNLAKRNLRSLIYSGDHDMLMPFLGTQAWIRALNYSIVDEWRPWFLQGQVAGYTRTYSNNMTFATVKGGGHTAPEYKPVECFAMFKRWVNREAL